MNLTFKNVLQANIQAGCCSYISKISIKAVPHGQMVPKNLVPMDKWCPTNLVPLDKWSLEYSFCPGGQVVGIREYGDQISWAPFV